LEIGHDFKNAVVKNFVTNPGLEENSVISLLLNPKNEFTDMEIFDEMVLLSIAVSFVDKQSNFSYKNSFK